MFKKSKVLFLIVTFSSLAGSSAGQILDRRANCKQNKAMAHLPTLESGIQFKPNFSELKQSLQKIDTNRFCECIFDKFEATYGAKKVQEMGQYNYSSKVSPTQLQQEYAKSETIYFACFGQQIYQLNLTPPSPQEISQAMAKPAPQGGQQEMGKKTRKALESVQLAVQMYLADHKTLPRSLTELTTPGEYIKAKDLKDSWGNNIEIRPGANNTFQLVSPGADGKIGTSDDIIL